MYITDIRDNDAHKSAKLNLIKNFQGASFHENAHFVP